MHFSHCIAYVCYKSDFPGIYKIVEDSAWVMRSRKSKDRQRKDTKKRCKRSKVLCRFLYLYCHWRYKYHESESWDPIDRFKPATFFVPVQSQYDLGFQGFKL